MRLLDWYDLEEEYEAWRPATRFELVAELNRCRRLRDHARRQLEPKMLQLKALEQKARGYRPGTPVHATLRATFERLLNMVKPQLDVLRRYEQRIQSLERLLSGPY